MKRVWAVILISATITTPLAAQDLRFRASFLDAGATVQTPPPPVHPPAPAPQGDHVPLGVTIGYGASLAAAAGGTIYVVNQTRRALDNHLDVRTFPLVWIRSSDPKDKARVTATIWAGNAAIMVASFLAFRHHQYKTAILVNAIVAGLTFTAGVRERNTINGK